MYYETKFLDTCVGECMHRANVTNHFIKIYHMVELYLEMNKDYVSMDNRKKVYPKHEYLNQQNASVQIKYKAV